MIPSSSPATPGLRQTSPPLGHCIRFSGARVVGQTFLSPCHCLFVGVAATTPRRRLAKLRQLVFFHAAPVFGPCYRVEYALWRAPYRPRGRHHRPTLQDKSTSLFLGQEQDYFNRSKPPSSLCVYVDSALLSPFPGS